MPLGCFLNMWTRRRELARTRCYRVDAVLRFEPLFACSGHLRSGSRPRLRDFRAHVSSFHIVWLIESRCRQHAVLSPAVVMSIHYIGREESRRTYPRRLFDNCSSFRHSSSFVPWRGVLPKLLLQMGTMLDPKKNSPHDFSVKDSAGKVLREPVVPMLMEELKVSTPQSLFA